MSYKDTPYIVSVVLKYADESDAVLNTRLLLRLFPDGYVRAYEVREDDGQRTERTIEASA